jgi:hypothetical protein
VRYLTVEQIKAYHRNEIPTADDEFIEAAILATGEMLEQSTDREWVVASSATTRLFVPRTPYLVRIDDCTTVTAVTSVGSTVSPSAYQLEPINGRAAGGVVPYTQIRLISGGMWDAPLYGEATVAVTATWGWAAIPARITQAALIIAKEIIVNRDEVKLGLIGFSDVGGVVARTNPIVRDTIAHYRRAEAFGIA